MIPIVSMKWKPKLIMITIEQIGIIAGIVLGILTLQTTVILWSINRVETSIKDLLKSEIKRLEDKIEIRLVK